MVNGRWQRPSPAARVGLLAACGALLLGVAVWAGSLGPWIGRPQTAAQQPELPTPSTVPTLPTLPEPPQATPPSGGSSFDPTVLLWVLGGVLLVALLFAAAALLRNRPSAAPARRREPPVAAPVPEVPPPDPERAFDPREAADFVIACWEQLEWVAAARGLPRRPQQTPTEFLESVQQGRPIDGRAAAELLALYQRARFDHVRLLPDTAARARACLDAVLPAVGARGDGGLRVGP